MYKDTITWNVFKGCLFNCEYCKKSFQLQAKRQKHRCNDCYNYKPHFHPERLNQYLPKNKLIFVAGSGDLYFALSDELYQILDVIKANEDKTFLIQSKSPHFLFDVELPDNIIVGTTIETNRDISSFSEAPSTLDRIYALNLIEHKRKFVTHEPICDFDLDKVLSLDRLIKPEIVWIGYDNHKTGLDEPALFKTKALIEELKSFTDVRLKTIREKLVN